MANETILLLQRIDCEDGSDGFAIIEASRGAPGDDRWTLREISRFAYTCTPAEDTNPEIQELIASARRLTSPLIKRRVTVI